MWILRSLSGLSCLGVIYLSAMAALVLGHCSSRTRMGDFPLSPIDRRIDALGAESKVRSEDDARAYVDALLEKFQVDERRLPGVMQFRTNLVHAELSAVLHPENRIPEALVGQIFNELMDELGMPIWTRITPEELHAYRVTMSLALYPGSVSRLPDGNLARTCRPVEALYLLYLLHANMGVPPELREAIRSGRYPTNDARALPPVGVYGLQPSRRSPIESQRLREYRAALGAYFAAHPDFRFENQVARFFARLRIE